MTFVVCEDHGTHLPHQESLRTNVAGITELCENPSAVSQGGNTRLEALVLHTGEFDLGLIQSAIRKTGVDPLGVPIVTLDDSPTAQQMTVLAAGAIARHREFREARPEHAKMLWQTLTEHRHSSSLGVPQYIGAPSIDPSLCSAERGCRLCVESCPVSALKPVSGSITYDVDTCVACGICVTTCPTGATVNPTTTEEQIAAQIRAMVSTAEGPIGIEFRCRATKPGPIRDGWYPVEAACTGMLTIGWILAPLVLGAGAVAAPSCGATGCPIGNDERVSAQLADASSILGKFGVSEGRMMSNGRGAVLEPLTGVDGPSLPNFKDTIVCLTLGVVAGIDDALFTSVTGSVGVVTINELACTACEQCVGVCPAHALAVRRHEDTTEISFDPILCVGCGMCVSTCPEGGRGAITQNRNFDIAALTLGPMPIFTASMSTCEMCGSPIAPRAMLDRIHSMLGTEHAETHDLISRRCLNCR